VPSQELHAGSAGIALVSGPLQQPHSCDIIKGLPSGLLDFLETLQNAGLCWLWQNTQGPGSWKKFMAKEQATVTSNNDSGGTTPLPISNAQAKQQTALAEHAQAPNGLLSKIGKG